VASIQIFEDQGILDHARRIGDDVIGPRLRELASRHPSVGEVRGLGVFWAVELVRSRATRQPLVPFNAPGADAAPMAELATALRTNGVWPFTHFNRLHFVPPCNVSESEVDEGVAALDIALAGADRYAE
jgi:taurine--2-oxoglutarate transaminase